MLDDIFEKFVCMRREWIGVACACTSDCVEEAEEPETVFKVVLNKMASAPSGTVPAMDTSMLKTYSEFDNVPGARVYGVLVGEWTGVGCGGSGQVYRVTGAGGESRVVKLLAWPRDETRRQAVEGVRAHLGNVDRIGSEYAVQHLGVYWGGGMDFDSRGCELPGGSQYGVVMEDGGVPLDQYLAEHALSYVERVRLAVGLSEAVGELHRLELVHRDLKPSNVVVDASMVVRLCDLDEVRDDIGTTMHSRTMESPMYACPVVGETGVRGSSADVYSLSLMVGEILVGLPVLGLYAEAVGRVRRRGGGE